MDAQRLFDRICKRHGIESERLAEYVPLVERAIVSPEKVRDKILMMIDDSLSRRASGDPSATFIALERDLDDEVLQAVAERLHGWAPHWKGPGGDDGAGGSLPEGLGGLL